MRIFVTGGTGLLGNTVLRQLTASGYDLLSLVRGQPDGQVFEGIQTDFASGDLLDADAIDQAVSQCDAVIHSAALIHIGWKRHEESMRINRDGTRHLVDACLKHDRKLIHVGTVDTLAPGTRDQPANETTPLENAGGQTPCNYVVSKRAGLEEVLRGVDQGLQAFIVHPGFMLGPWDWKPSSGRMFVEVARSWKPIAPSGGCSVCDVRDVASGLITLLDADVENGRQFILGGKDTTYFDLWTEMATRMGARKPILVASPLQCWIGSVVGDAWSMVAGEGDLNSAGVRMSSQFHFHDSMRARQELGYQNRDVVETLDEAADWIKSHHT